MKNKANWDSFVLTGCNTDPTDRDGAFGYGMYEQLVWGSFTSQNGRVYLSVQVTHHDPNTSNEELFNIVSVPIQYISLIKQLWGAIGDFAFSAESGTVQMYKSAWYDSGQLVPDQVTPASDATPLEDSGAVDGLDYAYFLLALVLILPYYTVNGINTVYGIFTAPTKVSSHYDIDNGANYLFHNHTESGTSVVYQAYVRLESAGNVTIVTSDQSTYYTNRITEILTQDVVSGVSNGAQIPITYDLANGGIINNMLQVNPTGRTYTTYNNGTSSSFAGDTSGNIQINPTAFSYDDANSTEINSQGIVIAVSSQAGDNTRGLQISAERNTLTFNGRVL
ncbi:MAG: hypothetical protein EZS28_002358 [Streblomastix strix]|uniref:Uncharacterized protein n=1 Tax=Streblomastix strix TaxID=222440 RepID=A0A5J4X4F1_9EUKA|nr:MAG: hypothetical protein EZS28_002358 [Streblomastix strix]